jgi:transposase
LLDKVWVSDLCDELGLQPTVLYRWLEEFFEDGAAVFQGKSCPDHNAEQQRIGFLEKKIKTKDKVLAELMAERIAPSIVLGEL